MSSDVRARARRRAIRSQRATLHCQPPATWNDGADGRRTVAQSLLEHANQRRFCGAAGVSRAARSPSMDERPACELACWSSALSSRVNSQRTRGESTARAAGTAGCARRRASRRRAGLVAPWRAKQPDGRWRTRRRARARSTEAPSARAQALRCKDGRPCRGAPPVGRRGGRRDRWNRGRGRAARGSRRSRSAGEAATRCGVADAGRDPSEACGIAVRSAERGGRDEARRCASARRARQAQ